MTSFALCLAAVFLGTNFSNATVPVQQSTDALHFNIPQMVTAESQYVELINQERTSRNLKPLAFNYLLTSVAREHSREMALLNYFDHYSPNANHYSPLKRYIGKLGCTPSKVFISENLYYCSRYDVIRGHRALMNSTSHRNNILDERFKEVGVGCYVSLDGRFWVTQMFLNADNELSQAASAAN